MKKRFPITFVVIGGLIVLAVVAIILLLPWMDRWGSTEAERAAGLPGDEMCPAEPAPPPYIVAQLHPNQALVLGHQEGAEWVDTWQFVLLPQPDGSTRLVLRTRTTLTGGIWEVIRPAVFVMEHGMLLGVKARAENLGG